MTNFDRLKDYNKGVVKIKLPISGSVIEYMIDKDILRISEYNKKTNKCVKCVELEVDYVKDIYKYLQLIMTDCNEQVNNIKMVKII